MHVGGGLIPFGHIALIAVGRNRLHVFFLTQGTQLVPVLVLPRLRHRLDHHNRNIVLQLWAGRGATVRDEFLEHELHLLYTFGLVSHEIGLFAWVVAQVEQLNGRKL